MRLILITAFLLSQALGALAQSPDAPNPVPPYADFYRDYVAAAAAAAGVDKSRAVFDIHKSERVTAAVARAKSDAPFAYQRLIQLVQQNGQR